VILLDLCMDDMNGLDVLARLRENPATAPIPVVVVTAQRLTASELERLAGIPVVQKAALTRERLKLAMAEAMRAHQETSA
jgi:CheY-like chemotaxis protein